MQYTLKYNFLKLTMYTVYRYTGMRRLTTEILSEICVVR
jgi:hypothetical protein